jgi:hypothetical protein
MSVPGNSVTTLPTDANCSAPTSCCTVRRRVPVPDTSIQCVFVAPADRCTRQSAASRKKAAQHGAPMKRSGNKMPTAKAAHSCASANSKSAARRRREGATRADTASDIGIKKGKVKRNACRARGAAGSGAQCVRQHRAQQVQNVRVKPWRRRGYRWYRRSRTSSSRRNRSACRGPCWPRNQDRRPDPG